MHDTQLQTFADLDIPAPILKALKELGYDFKEIKGLSVLFQVNNLTDTAFQTYSGSTDRPRGYTKYGRQMLFGFNYKL